jgi:O-antigen ligase
VVAACVGAVVLLLSADQSLVPQSFARTLSFPELTPYLKLFGISIPHALAERVYLQTSALQEFLQHPILGLGFHHSLDIPEGNNAAYWWGPRVYVPVAHNSYLTIAAQQGILGLVPFVILVVVGLRITRAAVRQTRQVGRHYDLAVGLRCAAIILVFASLNIDALYADFKVTMLFFSLVVAALVLSGGQTDEAATTEPSLQPLPSQPPA